MRSALLSLSAALLLGLAPAYGETSGRYVVAGVAENDMLKMRAGPGAGYKIVLGLPNGTELRVLNCESSGGHRWCKVSLEEFRSVRGYVSLAYLRKR